MMEDISNLCQFGLYECGAISLKRVASNFHVKKILGQVLGPIKNEGNEMS